MDEPWLRSAMKGDTGSFWMGKKTSALSIKLSCSYCFLSIISKNFI